MSIRWAEVERELREQAYGTLYMDPQILLERDGGPEGLHAELIYARLFGFDDEVVRDGWRLPRVEPVLYLPIMSSLRAVFAEPSADVVFQPTRRATYRLQAAYALVAVHGEFAPAGVPLRPDFTFRVLYLRYRRRA